MKRRRRVIQLVLLLFVGGAIVNVAVAWGCSTFLSSDVPRMTFVEHYTESESGLAEWSGTKWSRSGYCGIESCRSTMPDYESGDYKSATQVLPSWARQQIMDRQFANSGTEFRSIEAAGWPALALVSEYDKFEGALERRIISGLETSFVINKPGQFSLPDPVVLPLRPIWPGFAINTIFYAAMLWLLFFAPGAVRRTIRRRRGLCPACAYPSWGGGTSPVCTECGAAVIRNRT